MENKEVLCMDVSNKKTKKESKQLLMEGISKFETLMALAKSEGNKQMYLASEKSLRGLQARLKQLKES